MAAVCVLSGSVRVAEDEVGVFLFDKAAFPPCVALKDIFFLLVFSFSCVACVAVLHLLVFGLQCQRQK